MILFAKLLNILLYAIGLILAFRAYQRYKMHVGWFLTGLLGPCFLFWAYERARKNHLHEISASAERQRIARKRETAALCYCIIAYVLTFGYGVWSFYRIMDGADPHEAMPQQLQIQTITIPVASIVYAVVILFYHRKGISR